MRSLVSLLERQLHIFRNVFNYSFCCCEYLICFFLFHSNFLIIGFLTLDIAADYLTEITSLATKWAQLQIT